MLLGYPFFSAALATCCCRRILPPSLVRRPRPLDPARTHGEGPLNFHLDRSSHRQLHIGTVLQKRPRHSAGYSGQPAITRAVQASGREPANAPHGTPDRGALGGIL